MFNHEAMRSEPCLPILLYDKSNYFGNAQEHIRFISDTFQENIHEREKEQYLLDTQTHSIV